MGEGFSPQGRGARSRRFKLDTEEVQLLLQRDAEPANVGGVQEPLTLLGDVRGLGGRSQGPGAQRGQPQGV